MNDPFYKIGIRTFLKQQFYFKRKEKTFLKVKLSETYHLNCSLDNSSTLLILSIGYNNHQVLQHQCRLIKKYIRDDFKYIIIDNSSDLDEKILIERICTANKVGYISLPKNCHKKGSNSHGLALNWTYENLVKELKPAYFGLLDHDIYPINEHCLIPILLKQNLYGLKDIRSNIWYLWPGFCFFKTEFLNEKTLDFKPGQVNGVPIDTGGMLYENVYGDICLNQLEFPSSYYKSIRKGDIVESDKIQIINLANGGKWLHSINGSYWYKVPAKENVINNILNKY